VKVTQSIDRERVRPVAAFRPDGRFEDVLLFPLVQLVARRQVIGEQTFGLAGVERL
jgi:hypothetical protein